MLDEGVGVVIVNRLKVFCFNAIPSDFGDEIGAEGDIAHEVFDEDGIFVGPFGDGFFVGSFEEAIEFAGGRIFDEADHFFDPDWLGEADGKSDLSALVMGSVNADGFGARAERGHGNDGGDNEVDHSIFEGGGKADMVVHHADGAGDGG